VCLCFLSCVNMIVMMDIQADGVLMAVCDVQFHFPKASYWKKLDQYFINNYVPSQDVHSTIVCM
jgi:hypothetical protein